MIEKAAKSKVDEINIKYKKATPQKNVQKTAAKSEKQQTNEKKVEKK